MIFIALAAVTVRQCPFPPLWSLAGDRLDAPCDRCRAPWSAENPARVVADVRGPFEPQRADAVDLQTAYFWTPSMEKINSTPGIGTEHGVRLAAGARKTGGKTGAQAKAAHPVRDERLAERVSGSRRRRW